MQIKKRTALGLAAVTVLLFAVMTVIPHPHKRSLADGALPTNFGNELILPKGTASIETMELYADGRTPKFGVEDHADGSTTHYHFRPDGTLSDAELLGKADSGGRRPLLRKAVMATDGKTYISDTEHFEDGSLKKVVALQSNGSTTRRYYYAGGQLEKDQLMMRPDGKVWKLYSELAFNEDGSKHRVLTVTEGVSSVDTIYGPHEVVAIVKTQDVKTSTYREVWYAANGTTPVKEVEQTTYGTVITVKRMDGSISERYSWMGNIRDGYLTVTVMDASSRKRLEQNYAYYEGQLRMRSVDVYNPEDKRRTSMVLFYTTGTETGTVETAVTFEGDNGYMDPHVSRHYRKDGTLEFVKNEANTTTVLSERKFTVEQDIRARINPDWTKRYMVEMPPQVIEFIPEDD